MKHPTYINIPMPCPQKAKFINIRRFIMLTSDSVHCMVWDITDIFPCRRAPINCSRVLNVKPIYCTLWSRSLRLWEKPGYFMVKQTSTPSDLCLVMLQPIKPGATIIGPGLSLKVHSFYNSQEKWVPKRKRERKKETNKLRKETSLLLTLQLPSDELGIWLRSFWLFERELRIYKWIRLISRSFLSLLLNITWQQVNQSQAFSDNCFR